MATRMLTLSANLEDAEEEVDELVREERKEEEE